jgi:low affinity Fe/Cu permease
VTQHPIRETLTQFGVLTSHPSAFAIVVAYAMLWYIFERQTFDWHAVATLSTWMMTLFIQRATHRDTQAIQAKLDELIRADAGARNELAALDKRQPEEIERHREKADAHALEARRD